MSDRSAAARLPLHIVEILYSLLLLAWFVLPFFLPIEGLFEIARLPLQLFRGQGAALGAAALVFLIPLIRLYKIAAVFLGSRYPALADPQRTFPILLSVVSSALTVAAIALHTLRYASSGSYFLASSPAVYAIFLLSLAYNAFFLVQLIARHSVRDEAYREYVEFRRSGAGEQKQRRRERVVRQGIQKRLVLSFMALILLIVSVLAFVLMRDFSRTILRSVIDSGRALAERAASVIKANLGDDIAVDDYFTIEAQKNARAAFRFDALSFYRREAGTERFRVTISTDPARRGLELPEQESPAAASTQTVYRYDQERRVFEFLSPVAIRDIRIGLVLVEYARDAIYEPYFRTQVKVILIAALFLYGSAFLVYAVGRNIAFPILFLRMSVNAISNTLSGMIKGKLRISAELLQFKDRVRTRDEIKGLSQEIGNMTTVIRGVIPYVSASTLKHADREKPTTDRRELAFLFTDIRGFTTLCEGLPPDKVVQMLNHYLDIQSSIILANGGDIDKFVGDEIMAVFEGPRKELSACRSAMEIRKAMAQQKELARLASENVVSIGIGIHSGPVIFGSVGAKDRMDFTSIGDTVNLAARVEGANKTYGTKSLITGVVYAKVKDSYLCREIDMLTVKGKSQPARIYEILQEQSQAGEKLRRIKKYFEAGLALYRRQRWQEAARAFAYLRKEYRDEPSGVLLRRIELFQRTPPPKDWNGVFVMNVK